MRKSKTFRPDRIGSYFRMEWLSLALVTASGLIYNVGLLATPWFEGRLAQCLADILGGNETAAQMAVSGAGTLFILWFGAKNVLGTGWNAWDIAAFTTFLSCFTKLTVKSSKVAKLFNAVQKAEVSWKRIRPLMKTPEELPPLTVPAPADVTLENLSFAYGDTRRFSPA